MRAKSAEKRKIKYANTPMTAAMFDWVNNTAWMRKMDRASYIRTLIQREMDIEKAWNEHQEATR